LARKRTRTLAGLLAVIAVGAMLAAACGGGGGGSSSTAAATTTGPAKVAVAAWIGSICTSVSTWEKQLTQGTPDLSNPTDLAATKQAVADYLGKVVSQTTTLINEVKAAGIPDVTNGEAIANDFKSAIEPVGAAFQKAKSDVEAASTSDPAALASTLQKVGSDLTAAGSQASSAFSDIAAKYPTAELSQAAAKVSACKSLVGG
jgi:hypothetical protein